MCAARTEFLVAALGLRNLPAGAAAPITERLAASLFTKQPTLMRGLPAVFRRPLSTRINMRGANQQLIEKRRPQRTGAVTTIKSLSIFQLVRTASEINPICGWRSHFWRSP